MHKYRFKPGALFIARIDSGSTVTISDITIRNGRACFSAGIHNRGALTLMNVTLARNNVNGDNLQ